MVDELDIDRVNKTKEIFQGRYIKNYIAKRMVKYRRIRLERIKKYAIAAGLIGTPLALVLFMYLQTLGAITITGYSNDTICAGTSDDLCYAYLNFTANTDIYIYPNENWLFSTDKKLKLLKLQRSWGKGWRTIYLNQTWNSKVKYAIKFSKGKDYQIRFVGEKYNPYENIKWSFGEIDPVWKGIEMNYQVKGLNKNTKSIKLNLLKDFNLSELAKFQSKKPSDYLKLEKTKYFGDADIKLMEKINITKQRVKRTWKCNCTNKTINQTFSNNLTEKKLMEKNETIEKTIEVCQTCKEYENYTEEIMREINPETFILRKDKPIFEVFDKCKKIEKLPNGKWGCSVITNLYIMGVKIK